MKNKNAILNFLFGLIFLIGLVGCLNKTDPLREFESTITIEQRDLEYCVDRRLTNSPYANSGEVEGSTPSTSFTICTEEQFLEIGNHPLDWNKHFILKADLDFVHFDLDANHSYKPISVYRTNLSVGDTDFDGVDDAEIDYTEDDHPFTGVFNGNNHTIYRFRATFVNDEENQYKSIGMFPFLSVPGVIKNLKLVKHRVMKSDDDEVTYGMGMLVGYNDGGEIDNVHIESGSMYAGDSRVGGMVGFQGGGKIINSSVEFEDVVRGDNLIGGLVGEMNNGLVLQSSVHLNQIIGENNLGGLIGKANRTTIRDSKVYLVGNVQGSANNIGGFIGLHSNGAILYSSVEVNGITGNKNVGGFIGENESGEIHYSSSKVRQNIEGVDDYIGGFVGLNVRSPITNSDSFMKNISGKNYVGGFIGESTESNIENNKVEIDNLLTVNHHGGGLIGKNTGGLIYGANTQVLAIVANNEDCPHFATTGGLIGEAIDGEESEGRILYSQANITSSISGHGIVGGLVGKNNVEINYSQAVTNLIQGTGSSVGGLVGFNYSDGHYQSGRIEYSYAINSNTIVGQGNVGGLVGKNGHYRNLEDETSGVNPICDNGSEDVNGYRRAGGEIEFSYVDGETIYTTGEGHNVGGLVGYGWESRIQASYADVDKSVYGVGYNDSPTVLKKYPSENIGGFIGYAKDSSVRSSYARVGKVYGGYKNVGGFVGQSITSTFMYNFAVGDVEGFSSEGMCHNDENLTKQYPTQELCEEVGACDGNSTYSDPTSCNYSGYCYDPTENYSKSDLIDLSTPETCIQYGACYPFSTPFLSAKEDLDMGGYSSLDESSLNIANDGIDHVDYREKCLASFSCIDANGEIVEGVTTYQECISGGICLTTRDENAFSDDEGNLLNPFFYDNSIGGLFPGDEVTLSDGTTSSNYLRSFAGELVRDRATCCQYGGREDEDNIHEIRWVSNKWIKNYWVPNGFNWSYGRHTSDNTQCLEWEQTYQWNSTRSTENGRHTIPKVGRFAGGFDFHWSVENERYYHESLWIQNFTSNYADNTCSNASGKLVDEIKPADATNEDIPDVDAYDCTYDKDNSGVIDGDDDYSDVENLDQVNCHDYTKRVSCSDGSFSKADRACQCGHAPEDLSFDLYTYQQKEFIFFPEDVISCDDLYKDPQGGEEVTDLYGDTVIDNDQDQTDVVIGKPETCNDSMIKQFYLHDQLRVSFWVDNSEKPSTGCQGGDDGYGLDNSYTEEPWADDSGGDLNFDDFGEDLNFAKRAYFLEQPMGRSKVTEGDCYQERYFYKKTNAPMKYWDFYHFWDSYLDKYPTVKKVDQ